MIARQGEHLQAKPGRQFHFAWRLVFGRFAQKNKTSNTKTRIRGFTLIEALATLVLVGVVLPVAMRGVTVAMQGASRARHLTEATELARHKLTELKVTSTDPGSLNGTGDFGEDYPGYTWAAATATRDYGMTEYTVTVTWKAQGVDQSVAISSLFYAPVAGAAQ